MRCARKILGGSINTYQSSPEQPCAMFSSLQICFDVFKILHCEGLSMETLHRVFALFIWSWRDPSRYGVTMCIGASIHGGWGRLIFCAPVGFNIFFVCDQWCSFLRTLLQAALSRWLLNFLVSLFEDTSLILCLVKGLQDFLREMGESSFFECTVFERIFERRHAK